jgi:hypothetical protein
MQGKKDVLAQVHFGQRIAEQESKQLLGYFVETDQWKSILRGEVDVIYGAKGSGKSAIYSLLLNHQKLLEEQGISTVPAENPQGDAVFEDLKVDPPASEREFRGLWKLYFVCLIGNYFRAARITNGPAKEVMAILEEAELLPPEEGLKGVLHSVLRHVRLMTQAESISMSEVEIDPVTGAPKTVIGKITLRQPTVSSRKLGLVTPDDLFEKADAALRESGRKIWILLDRLDVVFESSQAESSALEINALRALFRTYLDCIKLENICLKLFLRNDIWKRITAGGFREASHISRSTTIRWHRVTLANLIARRLLHNRVIVEHYRLNPAAILSNSRLQIDLLNRIFPSTIDGSGKPFDWMLSRLHDGTGQVAPRELIHFLVQAKEIQLARLEVGVQEPPAEALFHQLAFSVALRDVSEFRFYQTLCQEYPQWEKRMLSLKGANTPFQPADLARIWHEPEEKAMTIAENLVEIGFFDSPDSSSEPSFSVPHLYRPALGIK